MKDYSSQEKEIKTITGRKITLNLSDADVERLSVQAGKVGLKINELLERFIGDMVDGTYSQGSDERDLADQWFERSNFNLGQNESLIEHIFNYGYSTNGPKDIESFLELIEDMKEAEENITYTKNHPEIDWVCNQEYWEEKFEELREEYNDFLEDYRLNNPSANIEEEIEKCQEWRKEYDLLREGEPTQAKKQLSPLELGNLQAKALENVKAIVKEKNLYEELVNNIDVNEIVLDEPMDQLEPGIEI